MARRHNNGLEEDRAVRLGVTSLRVYLGELRRDEGWWFRRKELFGPMVSRHHGRRWGYSGFVDEVWGFWMGCSRRKAMAF